MLELLSLLLIGWNSRRLVQLAVRKWASEPLSAFIRWEAELKLKILVNCAYYKYIYFFISHLSFPPNGSFPLTAQCGVSHAATGSGLIWAENSRRLSEERFVLSLLLMCIYAFAPQILLWSCQSTTFFKTGGAEGANGSQLRHVTTCFWFFYLFSLVLASLFLAVLAWKHN